MKPAQLYRSNSLSPWISPISRARLAGGKLASDSPCVLLVDDRVDFRQRVAAELKRRGMQVLTAAGPYDGWQLAHHRSVDMIVIRGDLQAQSGWQCVAKLCGPPPWRGVVMHFDSASDADRNWRFAAGLAGFVETHGRPQEVVEGVLRALGTAPTDREFPAPLRPLTEASQA